LIKLKMIKARLLWSKVPKRNRTIKLSVFAESFFRDELQCAVDI